MESIKKITTYGQTDSIKLDILCQEFDGKSFYGLEYIVEDFFHKNLKTPVLTESSPIDWFGLYD